MLYSLGKLGKYVYVYDSDTKVATLRDSGYSSLECLDDSDALTNKLRLITDIDKFEIYDVCTYNVYLSNTENLFIHMSIKYKTAINRWNCVFSILSRPSWIKSFSYNCYIPVEFNNSLFRFSNEDIMQLSVDTPNRVVAYIIECKNNKDFDGLMGIFCNLFGSDIGKILEGIEIGVDLCVSVEDWYE